jgi:hypothetical protein
MAKVETVTLRHFFPASILQQFLIGGSAQLSYFCFLLFCQQKFPFHACLINWRQKKNKKNDFFQVSSRQVKKIAEAGFSVTYPGGKFCTGVARFFLVRYTKTRKNIPNFHKIYQLSKKYQIVVYTPNVHIMYLHLPLQKPSKIYPICDFFCLKIYQLATLFCTWARCF